MKRLIKRTKVYKELELKYNELKKTYRKDCAFRYKYEQKDAELTIANDMLEDRDNYITELKAEIEDKEKYITELNEKYLQYKYDVGAEVENLTAIIEEKDNEIRERNERIDSMISNVIDDLEDIRFEIDC